MITVKRDNNKITFKGHANYSDDLDIVCASVSSIMYTTVNAIMRFDKTTINYQDDGKTVTIDILNNTKETDILVTNMMSLLKELESNYPKNIKIEMEEI